MFYTDPKLNLYFPQWTAAAQVMEDDKTMINSMKSSTDLVMFAKSLMLERLSNRMSLFAQKGVCVCVMTWTENMLFYYR